MALLTTGNGLPNVVVTGIAMTTALATDADNTWKNLLDGQSGIRLLDDPFVADRDAVQRVVFCSGKVAWARFGAPVRSSRSNAWSR